MIEYIVIAILQGLFEWLPISSSGQTMIIATNFFDISPEVAFSLSIWLHLGTTLAILLKFWREGVDIIKTIWHKEPVREKDDVKRRNWIIWATVGTGVTAVPLYFIFKIFLIDFFTAIQGDLITLFVSGLLIVTGIILILTKKTMGNKVLSETPSKMIQKDSFISGLVQGASILPGISRSGVTVSTILIERYDQDSALRLSFLMSVPVTIASVLVDIIFGEGSLIGALNILTIGIIIFVSFLIGYLTIDLILRLARKINFGYFCVLYGVIAYLIIVPFILIS
ncbi:MAG: undecaprenyl-diphosphate phosphatase [Promethearchaeota archaeon]|jgi:undecaprenyl-diphosphatase